MTAVAALRAGPPSDLVEWFHQVRGDLVLLCTVADPELRVPRRREGDMGIQACVTARLAETWAYAQDVADALGIGRRQTASLRHVARFAVDAVAAQLPEPAATLRVELTAPDGDVWRWGPQAAHERITGSALEFCLVATGRRPLAGTSVSRASA